MYQCQWQKSFQSWGDLVEINEQSVRMIFHHWRKSQNWIILFLIKLSKLNLSWWKLTCCCVPQRIWLLRQRVLWRQTRRSLFKLSCAAGDNASSISISPNLGLAHFKDSARHHRPFLRSWSFHSLQWLHWHTRPSIFRFQTPHHGYGLSVDPYQNSI